MKDWVCFFVVVCVVVLISRMYPGLQLVSSPDNIWTVNSSSCMGIAILAKHLAILSSLDLSWKKTAAISWVSYLVMGMPIR